MAECAPLTSRRPGKKSLIAGVVLILGLGYIAHILFVNLCDVAGGADSSGYLNTARMISRGNLVEPMKALAEFGLPEDWNQVFRPLGMGEGPKRDTLAPFYPIGIPLQMAGLASLFGWEKGPFLLSPLFAILGLLLFYFLALRLGLSETAALAGVSILGVSPICLFTAIQPLSDAVAMFWSVAAILAGLKARERKAWAAACGACFGIGVLVRPTNVLILIPILFALPAELPAYALFLAGGLPFGVIAMAANRIMYGSFLLSGYRNILGQDLALANFPIRSAHYAATLAKIFTTVIPLAALAAPFLKRTAGRTRALLVGWFLPILVFYCFYTFFDAWWYVRFLMPALPALVLAALLSAREASALILRKLPRTALSARIVAATAALLFVAVVGTEMRQNKRLAVLRTDEYEKAYKTSCLYIRDRLPGRTIVLSFQASGAVAYYTPFIVCRWDALPEGRFEELRSRAEALGYRFYALLFFSEEAGFKANAPGRWMPFARFDRIGLWQLDAAGGSEGRSRSGPGQGPGL